MIGLAFLALDHPSGGDTIIFQGPWGLSVGCDTDLMKGNHMWGV